MSEATPTAAGPKTSGLAIAALVFGVIPLCLLSWLGIVLGLMALSRIKQRPGELKGKEIAIVAIAAGGIFTLVGMAGCITAIAVPNYQKYQARSQQSSAKANLKTLYTAEKMHWAVNDEFVTFDLLDWQPEDGPYTYCLGDAVRGDPAACAEAIANGVESYVDSARFRAVAVGNIDSDRTVDVWFIDDDNNLSNPVNDVRE